MNAWDWFVAAMFVLTIAPIAAFVFLHALDEHRKKREAAANEPFERFNAAMRQYRRWR